MNKQKLHIAVMEPSQIIYEGLYAVLSQSNMECDICKVNSPDDLEQLLHFRKIDLLITNTLQLTNREKEIKKIRKSHPVLSIVGINSGIIDNRLLSLLDASFTIFDSAEQIISILQKAGNKKAENKTATEDNNLTDREIDVLVKLVHGFSNKEIAESLNISIHTVVTHRKNITTKTGIRSQSGLTIYAISKKIVSIDNF